MGRGATPCAVRETVGTSMALCWAEVPAYSAALVTFVPPRRIKGVRQRLEAS